MFRHLSPQLFASAPAIADAAQASVQVERLRHTLDTADAVIVGAGAGLSTAAGLSYSGARFEDNFADFRAAFGIRDMYAGGFYPFPDPETYWGWWSRHIYLNRYAPAPGTPYRDLRKLLGDRDFFVLTTNVDHQFQLAGFPRKRLFYMQGDYGLFQCSVPCTQETYDNEEQVRAMLKQQQGMRIPSALVPHCPRCGASMTVNLRVDDTFVEDAGWHAAQQRYAAFVQEHENARMLYLELGVGANTPGIVKYPFWQMTLDNPHATYACVNLGESYAPQAIAGRSILVDADIAQALRQLC